MHKPVDLTLEEDAWGQLGLDALAQAAAQATLARFGYDPAEFEISLLGCDDARIAALNGSFRNKATATNVLSWPSEERGAETAGGDPLPPLPDMPGEPIELGDIAIAYQTCAAEAAAAGLTLADHTRHLLVHGILHLLGYDHVRDQDALLMERLEVEILEVMGVSDPYCDDGPQRARQLD
ncbi:rRNA maturation RNase YbeY [Pseudoruegeria sp. SK021]|uniref:rRNA maturation RNase YbeY n=1 Tax=Pseudoruegeria sp. SK021 TaxID=1933035 RepID=UPI000A321DE5|nr:rRNA maturation RNase YbeY [Pseudoruegeria sp. SK021]